MSSIAEFYSRNLATEVIKGSVQKAKNGGTPGRAPIGYLNVRRMVAGREARTVEIDPVRGPLMAWAFESYATGEWTIRRLLAELTARGLTTAPGRKNPGRTLVVSHLHKLLRNPYYMGMVSYRGVIYAGSHDPLVMPETWHEVQKVLTAKYISGEKNREHPHYLKGQRLLRPMWGSADRQLCQRQRRHVPVLRLRRAPARHGELQTAGSADRVHRGRRHRLLRDRAAPRG
jgi:site-specific DNA recombinase